MASIGALIQQGANLHRQGKLAEARGLYERVLAQDPKQFDATHLAGLTWLQQGEPAKAEALLRRAVGFRRDIADAHLNLGKALSALDRFDDAMACAREALRLKPDHAKAADDLQRWEMFAAAQAAEAALARDDIAAAAPLVSQAVRIGPNLNNRGLSFRLALAHLRRGDYDAASEALLEPVWQLHNPDGGLAPPIEPFTTTSPAKLRHDIEQLRHLRALGVLDAGYDRVIADFAEVLAALPPDEPRHKLTDAERRRLGWQYNRLLHLAPAPAMPDGVLNPALNG